MPEKSFLYQLPSICSIAHLKIHFVDKQPIEVPGVKVLTHLGAEAIITGRSVGAARSQV